MSAELDREEVAAWLTKAEEHVLSARIVLERRGASGTAVRNLVERLLT